MNQEAQSVIAALGLRPLPREGGFFAETWLGAGSSIYFMITPRDFSAFHRLRTDEVWHFHAGDPAELVELDPETGGCRVAAVGPDIVAGDAAQIVARGGRWQAARTRPGIPESRARGWTLFGCILAPAWDEKEFELGNRADLLRTFPAHADWVRALTRGDEPASLTNSDDLGQASSVL